MLTVAGLAVYRVITSRAVEHAVSTALTVAAVIAASAAGLAVLAVLALAVRAARRKLARPPAPLRAVLAHEPPAVRLVSVRALPEPGPTVPLYGPQEPAGAPRVRRGRR